MKKYLSLLLILALIFSLAGPAQAVNAATIKISQKTATVIKGDYLYLDIKGTSKKATWTSSNKRVATVSKTGKVTTISKGKATITAKVSGKKYSCKVTVVPNKDPDYMTDTDLENALSERNAIDKWTSADSFDDSEVITVTPSISPTDRDIDGMDYYQYEYTIPKSDSEWITIADLSSKYGYDMIWSSEGLTLAGESRYLLKNAPRSMTPDTIYECKYNDTIIHMKYSDAYFFNIADLKVIGLLK